MERSLSSARDSSSARRLRLTGAPLLSAWLHRIVEHASVVLIHQADDLLERLADGVARRSCPVSRSAAAFR